MWRKRRKPIDGDERSVGDPERSRQLTMKRALKLLAAKPRSVRELRERLLEKRWTDEVIVDAIIEKLIAYKYLDDLQYASDFALSRLRRKPQGIRRLERTLSEKKLDEEHVRAALASAFEALPENDLIDAAIEKRFRLKGRPTSREDLRRLVDHLLRLGFSFDLIRSRTDEIMKEGRSGNTE